MIKNHLTSEELKSRVIEILEEYLNNQQSTDSKELYISRKQARERYGVAEITWWKWVRAGKLREYRLGSRVRLKVDEIESFLKERNFSMKTQAA